MKYELLWTIYECVEKLSMIICWNIRMICLELNWLLIDWFWGSIKKISGVELILRGLSN